MYRVRKQISCPDSLLPKCSKSDITVAILDTGIANHPDLTNRIVAFHDFVNFKNVNYDDCGHGTHVAGCIGGDGTASKGQYRGIHPKCNFVVGKILNEKGDGDLDALEKGLEWILDCANLYNICVVNISLGLSDSIAHHRIKRIIQLTKEAWKQGILLVCAAGNTGPKSMSLSALGEEEHIICVGCNEGGYFGERKDLCEHYSGRGPSKYALKKPDIVAPGTDIISCNYTCNFVNKMSYRNAYTKKSGTSMATPIVTGAVALLLEHKGRLSCAEAKRRLLSSATDLQEPWEKQGWGMVHVENLIHSL